MPSEISLANKVFGTRLVRLAPGCSRGKWNRGRKKTKARDKQPKVNRATEMKKAKKRRGGGTASVGA